MKYLNRIIVALVALTTVSAHAGVGILGGANWWNYTDSGIDTKANIIGGLAFDTGLTNTGGLELDVLYARNSAGGINFSALQVPVLFRFNPISILNFGLGGYYQYAFDDIPGHQRSDAGALGSVRIAAPLGGLAFYVEGRYLLGLTNQWDGGNQKTRAIQALAGFQLGI